jgi:hypothetical protein
MSAGVLQNIEIPIYRIVINVMVHKNCAKAVKLSKRLTKEFYKQYDWKAMHGAYVYSEQNNIHSIVLAGDAGIETIAHECFHAVMSVLQLKGIGYSQKSEECFAYVLGYLVKKVVEVKQEYDKTI